MERAQTQQIGAVAFERDAFGFDQALQRHFLLQPLDLMVGDARHRGFSQNPVKSLEQDFHG